MVVETIVERELTSKAILDALRERDHQATYATDLLEGLQANGIDPVEAISTVWRLIDENRLFFDNDGSLVLDEPERG